MPIGLISSLGFLWISKHIAVDSSELDYKTLMFAKKKNTDLPYIPFDNYYQSFCSKVVFR